MNSNVAYVKWARSYNGGSPQTFEIWLRDSAETDSAGWKVIKEIESTEEEDVKNNDQEEIFHLNKYIKKDETADQMAYFFSVRAHNERGFSGFSPVVKLVEMASDTGMVKGSTISKYIDGKRV